MLENLGTVERRVYRAYWNDGLLDLLGGLGILAIGVCWLFDQPVAAAAVPVVLIPFWGPLRHRWVEPRLGIVEFSDTREQKTRSLLSITAAVGVVFFALGIVLFLSREKLSIDPAVSLVAGLPSLLLALLALIAAAIVATPRFIGYSVILFAMGLGGALLGWQPGAILAAAGLVILAAAASVIARFLRSHPIDNGDVV